MYKNGIKKKSGQKKNLCCGYRYKETNILRTVHRSTLYVESWEDRMNEYKVL